MNSVMEKMMSMMMKPEDMPEMMNMMMDKMFSEMSGEDRIEFISTMMPKCLNLIFAELDADSKERVAREFMGRMSEKLEDQL